MTKAMKKGSVLSSEEKMIVLSHRCKEAGISIHEALGVSRVTVSGWIHGKFEKISAKHQNSLVELSGGLLEVDDFEFRLHPEEPKPKKTRRPRAKKVKPVDAVEAALEALEDDLDI